VLKHAASMPLEPHAGERWYSAEEKEEEEEDEEGEDEEGEDNEVATLAAE
jgi:hypothetical protein